MVALEVAFPTLLLATHRYAPLSFLLTFVIVNCSLSVDKRIRTSSFGFIANPFFVHDIVKELPVALQKRVKFSPSLIGSACGCVSITGVTVQMQESILYLKVHLSFFFFSVSKQFKIRVLEPVLKHITKN